MEALRQVLARDQFARLCGIELISVAPGQAHARMNLGEQHLNGIGTIQGGAIFTLADFAFAAASNSHGGVAVGINVSINYFKAVVTGVLQAEAKEVSLHHKLATYLVEIRDDANDLVALFQGTVYRKTTGIAPRRVGTP
jgi:acyl-CoA thioesterase